MAQLQKSMSYDHAAYLAVYQQPALSVAGTGITGSGTNTQKYAAFTSLLVKSITAVSTVLGTSADSVLLFRITNNGTTAVNTVTATYTYGTVLASAAYFGNVTLNTASAVGTSAATSNTLTIGGSPALLQGDQWYLQKGTDATCTNVYAVEMAIVPLANVAQ
jgi:hypothetical protein